MTIWHAAWTLWLSIVVASSAGQDLAHALMRRGAIVTALLDEATRIERNDGMEDRLRRAVEVLWVACKVAIVVRLWSA